MSLCYQGTCWELSKWKQRNLRASNGKRSLKTVKVHVFIRLKIPVQFAILHWNNMTFRDSKRTPRPYLAISPKDHLKGSLLYWTYLFIPIWRIGKISLLEFAVQVAFKTSRDLIPYPTLPGAKFCSCSHIWKWPFHVPFAPFSTIHFKDGANFYRGRCDGNFSRWYNCAIFGYFLVWKTKMV